MEESKVPEWERVTEDTFRLEVPGGWLYEVCGRDSDGGARFSICFVPTPVPPVSP